MIYCYMILLLHILQVNFEFIYSDIDKQAVYLASSKNDTGLIIANPEQNVFLFTDRLKLQVSCARFEIAGELCKVCFVIIFMTKITINYC